jgi:hypothetical protein
LGLLIPAAAWGVEDCLPDFPPAKGSLQEFQRIVDKVDPPACRTRPPQVSEGFQCRTTRGVRFERILEPAPGWRDLGRNGKVWFDQITNEVSQPEAIALCEGIPKQILPTKEDFRQAERHGFQEVLNDMFQFYYWSRSSVPDQDLAYGFSSGANVLATMNKGAGVGYVAARCVGK